MLVRIIAASLLMIVLALFKTEGWLRLVLYLIPYLTVGYDILIKAGKRLLKRQMLDENFLMALATVGAMTIGITDTGDYAEAVFVMLFYQIGELFQSYAIGKSRKNIGELMDIRPDYANIEKDDGITRTAPDEVEVGSVIVVNPGEKIPIDGTILDGHSALNTSALTGESLPRDVKPGDEVISGCINLTGVLRIRTTKEFGESTASKILELVENASSHKSRSEKFITKFAKIYTPAVCFSALLLSVFPPLIHLVLGQPAKLSIWLYRALTFLVASCPCALLVSIPLGFFAGLGGASKHGILVKGSNYLETLSKTNSVVFDKTGTLTKGVFEVNAVHHNRISKEKLIEYAALAECASPHPIAQSLRGAYGAEIDRNGVSNIQEIIGGGVTATIDGHVCAVGNDRMMKKLGIKYHECDCTGTVVHVAVDGEYQGHIVIGDTIKPSAKKAVTELKKIGVQHTVILTGDSESVAKQVAALLDVDAVFSELLPSDKIDKIEELIANKPQKASLVFVGDGINDAPVLARADIGIAMGAIGSDAAIEAADIVLMDDDPLKIVTAIRISRKCLRIIRQNIVFAIGVKLLSLILVALGTANMWLAIFADVGVMVLAVLNAIRALFVEKI